MDINRRSARYDALTTASQMIRDFYEGGFEGDEVHYTEEETELFIEECAWVADMLDKKAKVLIKGYSVIENER